MPRMMGAAYGFLASNKDMRLRILGVNALIADLLATFDFMFRHIRLMS